MYAESPVAYNSASDKTGKHARHPYLLIGGLCIAILTAMGMFGWGLINAPAVAVSRSLGVTNTPSMIEEPSAVTPCEFDWIGDYENLVATWYAPDTSLTGVDVNLCPTDLATPTLAQYQPYENGFTIYVNGWVYAFINDGLGWVLHGNDGKSTRVATPPPGFFPAGDYFSEAWLLDTLGSHGTRINPSVRLGWATAPSQAYDAEYQQVQYIAGDSLNWGTFVMITQPNGVVVGIRQSEGREIMRWNADIGFNLHF